MYEMTLDAYTPPKAVYQGEHDNLKSSDNLNKYRLNKYMLLKIKIRVEISIISILL